MAGTSLVGISGKGMQFSRAAVQREAYEQFLRNHQRTLAGMIAKALGIPIEDATLDPNLAAVINTFATHFFLVGVVACREEPESERGSIRR